MTEDLRRCVALSLVKNLGPVTFRKCLEAFGSPEAIFESPASELRKIEGMTKVDVARLGTKTLFQAADAEIEKALKRQARIVTFLDEEYPFELKQIYDPPILFYMKGSLPPALTPKLAVVGSRDCSPYGAKTARNLSRDLAASGVAIVSGMALGVDTAAHEGALDAGGATIAVLGGGLSKVYPAVHQRVFAKIAEKGAILSEYPMDEVPRPAYFPIRNRIISGLSKAVLVVEAKEKSGALITVDAALAEGREVFAVPGNVDSPRSRGTNFLIRQGARPVTSAADILEDLGIFLDTPPKPKTADRPAFGGDEGILLSFLEDDDPRHVDDLIEKSGLEVRRAVSALTKLTLRGVVHELPGKYFINKDS